MERSFDDDDLGDVALPHVGGVWFSAISTVRKRSGPPVASERAEVPQVQIATDSERAVRAAWNSAQVTSNLEPESLGNAVVDFGGGFLLAFGKPVVEDWFRKRFGVSLDIPQETYAQIGVLGTDVLYNRYQRD